MKQDLITIENDGIILQQTNYFDTQQAQAGEFYLTWNKGHCRLLVPDSMKHFLNDMKVAKLIEMEKIEGGVRILFDDLSDMPFSITIDDQQTDRDLTPLGKFTMSVYVRVGEKYYFENCTLI